MSKKDKLLKRLKSRPKDFTYNELKTLLEQLGFTEDNKGTTSGSAVKFINHDLNKYVIQLHKPHPVGILKSYQIRDVLEKLKRKGVI